MTAGLPVPPEAVEAAVRAYIADDIWESAPAHQHLWRDGIRDALAAAAPFLLAQARAEGAAAERRKIAAEIEAERDRILAMYSDPDNAPDGFVSSMDGAAWIARGRDAEDQS